MPPHTSPGPSERCRDGDPPADLSAAGAAPAAARVRAKTNRRTSGDPSAHWYATSLAMVAEEFEIELEAAIREQAATILRIASRNEGRP